MRLDRWAAPKIRDDEYPPDPRIERRRARKRIKALDRRELPEHESMVWDEDDFDLGYALSDAPRRPMFFDDDWMDAEVGDILGFGDREAREFLAEHPEYCRIGPV